MRTPDDLDQFVTMIPHYELHAADSWDVLKRIETNDANAETQQKFANETLLINTRKDAHQLIDNIRFKYNSGFLDATGGMNQIGVLTMEVTEPNGTSFIEKILNLAAKFQVSNLQGGLIFGIKIFFVGRFSDGSDHTIPFKHVLPLNMSTFDAKFDNKGGQYFLTFQNSASAALVHPINPASGLSRAVGYTNKNMSIQANTLQEAIAQLEQNLNDNYNNVYSTDLINANGSKQLKYKINLDPELSGILQTSTKTDTSPSAKCVINLDATTDITSMIRKIMSYCTDVNKKIANSREGLKKEFHPDVQFPTYQSMYHLQSDSIELIYNIKLYKGGTVRLYEFDYWFMGAGKNVDVLEFETHFNNMQFWMSSSALANQYHHNMDGSVPSTRPGFYSQNDVHPDITRPRLENAPNDRKNINAEKGDPATLPASPQAERTGFISLSHEVVDVARLAFESASAASGSTNLQLTFLIRGRLDLLNQVQSPPDGSTITQDDGTTVPYGVTNSIWMKVNIHNSNGEPFFYTGYYLLLSIENIFQGGRFLQSVTVKMSDDQTNKQIQAIKDAAAAS